MDAEVLLRGSEVSKSFGGVRALDRVDFCVHAGEILGLIGPNGAGKTTLVNVITGVVRPSAGELYFNGRRLHGLQAHQIAALGIARSFQISRALLGMTVEENVTIGALFGSTTRANARGDRAARVAEILGFLELDDRRGSRVEMLNVVDRKKVDLGRALAMDPSLLLLDELMAGLNPVDLARTIRLVQEIHRQGISLIITEHVLKTIVSLCDRVMVLDQGRKIADGPAGMVLRDRTVMTAYLGTRSVVNAPPLEKRGDE